LPLDMLPLDEPLLDDDEDELLLDEELLLDLEENLVRVFVEILVCT